jgi:hypothetical protein
MIEAGAPSTGGYVACSYGVPAPPGTVMLSPPEVPRNAERAQRKAALRGVQKARPKDIIRAGARKPRPRSYKNCRSKGTASNINTTTSSATTIGLV